MDVDQHGLQSNRMLVRVKRRLDDESIPELIVKDVAQGSETKRLRPDGATLALRLVDSVGCGQWHFDGGLPHTWLRAAADATWRQLPSAPSAANRNRTASLESALAAVGAGDGGVRPVLREVARTSVRCEDLEDVEIVDVEMASAPVEGSLVKSVRRAMGPAVSHYDADGLRYPASHPAAGGASVASPSIFTVDGQPLVAVTPPKQQVEEPLSKRRGCEDDLVWDVYAPSALDDTEWNGGCGANSRFSALVQLASTACFSDEALNDMGDIDDLQSDSASSGAGDKAFGLHRGSSSDDDLHDGQMYGLGTSWTDTLD
eukprot:TRINITY_DN44034_c0_g1_i1.p1 TRINITY_DN44034_c0_g1~~TRINITY_DN44034_c0_g1_i1.p1  ORF type:complete len:316 (-),score=47.82 TRINITY_DN44034_c0_g1_i1:61-1008(-)